MKFLLFLLIFFTGFKAAAPQMRLRGLRIDTGYFYNLYPGLTIDQITSDIIAKAQASVVNTLFIYAYNPVYGALYPTDYRFTSVEPGFGRQNIFRALAVAAKAAGLKVVAVVPVNNFQSVWEQRPDWRAKTRAGADYVPGKDLFLLSAWHPDFRTWLSGFYQDLITRNPEIDGVEAVEPCIDYNWDRDSDYNPWAVQRFRSLYPQARPGLQSWLNFRAQGLTDLIAILNSTAAAFKKASFLVQTWPVNPDGSLLSFDEVKNNLGLDMNGILNLAGPKKLGHLIAEFMWQQWAAEYGPENFSTEWTRKAALELISLVEDRSAVLIHIEVSAFKGAKGVVTPTRKEFSRTLSSLRDLEVGIEVYDHHQITKSDSWKALLNWN